MRRHITAVVVTFNRKQLLRRCLQALSSQLRAPDRIIVVDNASSDGTGDMLETEGWTARADFVLLRQRDNTGGAGGFAAGMARAVDLITDWLWLMDDDATPLPDALQRLDALPLQPGNLYGSVAASGGQLSWPMQDVVHAPNGFIYSASDLPEMVSVRFLPFVGLLVSRELVCRIGVPDAGFFIAADDVEYSFRARAAGAEIILVSCSRIDHPASERYHVQLPWRRFHTLRLPPWKRYYDVRNRILVAKRHFGWATYYQTLPVTLLHLVTTLLREPQRLRQLQAFAAGITDGLLSRKGSRHEQWGIRP